MSYFISLLLILASYSHADDGFLTSEDEELIGGGEISTPLKYGEDRVSEYKIEANIQAQSIAASSSPLVGPSLLYTLVQDLEFGVRVLIPMSSTVDRGAYSGQALLRYAFYPRRTQIFVEGSLAYNLVNFKEFTSTGSAIGANYNFNKEFGIGGSAGFEFANAAIDSVGVRPTAITAIYPKVLVFTSLNL